MKLRSIRNATVKQECGKVVVKITDPETTVDKVVDMTGECRKGNNSCCGPQFFEKVADLYVSGKDGNVDINIIGDGITEHEMKERIRQCDCIKDED
ncbi:MAG: hypothetical protein ACYCSO_07295 [Cuniculiplasma sp.]